jgi:hypothetical protein
MSPRYFVSKRGGHWVWLRSQMYFYSHTSKIFRRSGYSIPEDLMKSSDEIKEVDSLPQGVRMQFEGMRS